MFAHESDIFLILLLWPGWIGRLFSPIAAGRCSINWAVIAFVKRKSQRRRIHRANKANGAAKPEVGF